MLSEQRKRHWLFLVARALASTNIMPRYRMTLPLRLLISRAESLRATEAHSGYCVQEQLRHLLLKEGRGVELLPPLIFTLIDFTLLDFRLASLVFSDTMRRDREILNRHKSDE